MALKRNYIIALILAALIVVIALALITCGRMMEGTKGPRAMHIEEGSFSYVWDEKYGGNLYDSAYDVKIIGNTVYAVGALNGTNTAGSGFLLSIDRDGSNFSLDSLAYGPGGNAFEGLEVDALGNIYVVGWYRPSVYSTDTNVIVAKYSSSGAAIWTQILSTNAKDEGYGIDLWTNPVDLKTYVLVGGFSEGGIDVPKETNDSDAFVAQLDGDNGNIIWVTAVNSDNNEHEWFSDLAVASDGTIYAVGTSRGNFPGQNNSGSQDMLITKIDSSGVVLANKLVGSTQADVARSIDVDEPNGKFAIVGFTNGVFPGETHFGNSDGILAVFDLDLNPDTSFTGDGYFQYGSAQQDRFRDVKIHSDHIFYTGYTNDQGMKFGTPYGDYDGVVGVCPLTGYEHTFTRYGTPNQSTYKDYFYALDVADAAGGEGHDILCAGLTAAPFSNSIIWLAAFSSAPSENTPAGRNVSVRLPMPRSDPSTKEVAVKYTDVTEPGNTAVQMAHWTGALPEGFDLVGTGTPPAIVLETTAVYDGPITISVEYDDTGMTQAQEEALRLMQWEEAPVEDWVDITTSVDTVGNIIYGETTHLSYFGIMLLTDPVAALNALIAKVQAIDTIQGISFTKKLENAQAALTDKQAGNDASAINRMQAFINECNAQRNKELTDAQATDLIHDATLIMKALL
jgi:hypothetical protein